ncbi:hypothetical protein QQ045_024231 [Rhodiola kirilowii]
MKVPWRSGPFLLLAFLFITARAQDYDYGDPKPVAAAPPPEQDDCNGIFLSYNFISREKELPRLKNSSAQAWAFKSELFILNAGETELKGWQVYVGFKHKEILVAADGAVVVGGSDFPVAVGNGTRFVGYPLADLKTSIETAGDYNQISARVSILGTQFGVKPPAIPMPKTIKLENDGYKCPAPKSTKSSMHVCCKRDPKIKLKTQKKTKFQQRQWGDLSITYDVLQAYSGSYLAQVTMDNINPLGRLDSWNLTWEWMRGEFIQSMRGAYTHKKDYSECIYGAQGQYYKDMDFSQVMNCEKKPVISDLPSDRAKDEKVGNLPYCCRNGSLLPVTMDPSKARSIFQLNVLKMPPDMNRTAINPPQHWQINGIINPHYKCGPPIRVEPTEFPDPSGLQAKSYAVASWQVVCNITRPKPKQSKCCVSFSAFYNDSVVPCNTCACGCDNIDTDTCDEDARALLLPAEALLVPFDNRTEKAKAWGKLKNFKVPRTLPCPDNCGVSINWHVNSDYKSGWTARITLFNWEEINFEEWFAAIQINKAYPGYENVYSFNGTKLPEMNNTILMQGLKGLNYLMGEMNGTHPDTDPRVPGKQQSVISFSKKHTHGINILKGDGFPTKVYFNGEECALPVRIPTAGVSRSQASFIGLMIILSITTLILLADLF